ncbi:MAG: hypothetical protein B6D58_06345 [candidate division Zixibacteria bacterium 4484_95]|mgnify:CR=1 FL=1|nr:MAG: hypothetical protein B6D58_06345 [candidate division Zixibacteria bacterium 4484_95]
MKPLRLDSKNVGYVKLAPEAGQKRLEYLARFCYSFNQDGSISLEWDGRDHKGEDVSSGVYFISLQAQNGGDVKKVILLR